MFGCAAWFAITGLHVTLVVYWTFSCIYSEKTYALIESSCVLLVTGTFSSLLNIPSVRKHLSEAVLHKYTWVAIQLHPPEEEKNNTGGLHAQTLRQPGLPLSNYAIPGAIIITLPLSLSIKTRVKQGYRARCFPSGPLLTHRGMCQATTVLTTSSHLCPPLTTHSFPWAEPTVYHKHNCLATDFPSPSMHYRSWSLPGHTWYWCKN